VPTFYRNLPSPPHPPAKKSVPKKWHVRQYSNFENAKVNIKIFWCVATLEQSINKLHVAIGVETEAKIYKSVLTKSHVH